MKVEIHWKESKPPKTAAFLVSSLIGFLPPLLWALWCTCWGRNDYRRNGRHIPESLLGSQHLRGKNRRWEVTHDDYIFQLQLITIISCHLHFALWMENDTKTHGLLTAQERQRQVALCTVRTTLLSLCLRFMYFYAIMFSTLWFIR